MGTSIEVARMILTTFIPQRRVPDPRHAIPAADTDLAGTTVVFVGGTDGMGRVAVEMLYGMGADIVLLGCTEAKGRGVVEQLARPELGTITFELCDLASMVSIQRCAARVLAGHKRIDILVNCAGANFSARSLTDEGFERVWAINYLGPFLLTNLLLDRMKASAPARIVNLSSQGQGMGHIHFDDLQLENGWSAGKSYAQAKLAVNMFTIELASQLDGTGVTVNALNPGFIRSNLLRDLKGVEGLFRGVMRVFASPPEVGADRIVRLAISSEYEGVSGAFVFEDAIRTPNPEALDRDIRERLMAVSRSAIAPWARSVFAETAAGRDVA